MGNNRFIIGIDEAGRGPLAGPVVVAGVKMELRIMNYELRRRKFFNNIRDSKKLTTKQREEWFEKITAYPKIEWAVAKVWPKMIDRINISQAANLGVLRVYRKLSTNNEFVSNKRISEYRIRPNPFVPNGTDQGNSFIRKFVNNSLFVDDTVLLDGGLYLPRIIPQQTIVKGDEKIPVISAASIIAKVTRDRLMLRLHKKFPRYRFDIHKGYPTKLHKKMIKKFGRSRLHRKSFGSI